VPIESAKEAAKAVVETPGILPSLLNWFGAVLLGAGATIAAMWRRMGMRLSRVEREASLAAVIKQDLANHTTDENLKFAELFRKHDNMADKLHNVGEAVARIEGKLER